MVTTLADLKTQVRQRLNIENATHISDAEIYNYLNFSLARLYALVTKANEDYELIRYVFQFPNLDAQDGYPLPSNLWKILRVDHQISGNNWYRLMRINKQDETDFSNPNVSSSCVTSYDTEVTGGITYLRVYPTNNRTGTYRVLYYPAWQDLTADDPVVIGPPGQHFEEYAVLDTCIKCCLKDETDPSGFMAQLVSVTQQITSESAARDVGQAVPLPTISWYDKMLGDASDRFW